MSLYGQPPSTPSNQPGQIIRQKHKKIKTMSHTRSVDFTTDKGERQQREGSDGPEEETVHELNFEGT